MPDATPTASPAAATPNPAANPWVDTDGAAAEPGAQAQNPSKSDNRDWEAAKARALSKEPAAPAKAAAKGKDKKTPEPAKADAAPPTEEPTAEPGKEKPPSAREWAVLNHKREKLAKDQAAFNAKYDHGQKELAALETRAKELDARQQQFDALDTDPRAMVEYMAKKLGLSRGKIVNTINELLLDESKNPSELRVAKLEQDLKRRDEEAAAKKERDAEDAKKADQQAREGKVTGYQRQIADFVKENADHYVHLTTFNEEDVAKTAWGRIKSHYDKTKESLPLDEVLATLEAEEEQKFVAREERRKRKLGSAEAQNPERGGADQAASREVQQRPSTLNHGLATQRGQPARQLSDREAWEEAKKRAGV